MNKKKWKRVIKFILVILLIFLAVALIVFIKKKTSKKRKADDFINIKELVEYTGCEYYKTTSSNEEGFEGDYYIRFSVDPIDESLPAVNKAHYENVILSIEDYLKFKDIRIIDESRKLVVRTKCDKDNKVATYTINGIDGYFEKRLAKIQVEQNKEKISNFKINSPELNSIINVNWVRRSASLGKVEQSLDGENYDRYTSEGYKVRVIGTKIYNIVFNENYKKDVIENVKPGMKLTEVASILGEPTYKQVDDIEGCDYIGYKLDSCYVFFSDVISVYPIVELDDDKNNRFAEALSEYEKSGSRSDFLKKITEIYPNYNELVTNGDYTRIEYAIYGFSITFDKNYTNMVIYNNYQGKIDKDVTVEELKLGLKYLPYVETRFSKNALEYAEADRVERSR